MDITDHGMLEKLPVSVVISVTDQIIYANPAALDLLEASSPADLVGHSIHEFIYPLDQQRILARVRRAERGQVTNPPTEFRVYTCTHRLLVVAMMSSSFPVEDKIGLIATFMDMTERSAMETRLRESDEQFRRMMNTMQDVFYRTDAEGITRYVCPSVINILGYSAEEIIGLPAAAFYPNVEDRDMLVAAIKNQGYVRDFPGQMQRKDGKIIDISISSTVLYDEEGNYAGVEGIWRDITSRRDLERELERRATSDELTGIANRRSILEDLEQSLARFQRHHQHLTIFILDLDHFKKINDEFGHLSGDKVLKKFCEIVTAQLRAVDRLGRLGGEEFLLILNDTHRDMAQEIAMRILTTVREHLFHIDPFDPVRISVSIGAIVAYPDDRQVSQLLERADKALYCAKAHGRDRIQWWAQEPSAMIPGQA